MRYEILHWVWDNAQGDPYMATIDRNHGDAFQEQRIKPGMEIPTQRTPGQDLFFTPLTFDGPRHNTNARGLGLLFADLDHIKLDIINQIPPHLLWQTGPTTTQGIWKLNARIGEHDAWADLNQRMTYYMQADKGGWHGSKFLRVPETINYKYSPGHVGTVLHYKPQAVGYDAEALRAKMPAVEQGAHSDEERPEEPTLEEWKALVHDMWPDLSLGSRSALVQRGARDRSRFVVAIVNKLMAEGHSKEETFSLVWGASWNKWRTDRHRPDYLWDVISRDFSNE